MAWYEVKYACGHTGQVQLYGKTDSREWRLHQMEHEDCPECCKKAREEADRKAAEKNAADGLPSLTGTEKQVLWAEKIRRTVFEEIEKRIAFSEKLLSQREAKGKEEKAAKDAQMIEAAKAAYFDVQQETSAKWWIEHQDTAKFEKLVQEYLENPKAKSEILEPEEPKHDGVAEVKVTPTQVEAIYDKNEDFRTAVKEIGYAWNGEKWTHSMTVGAKSLADLAADTVNRLIKTGFSVKVSPEIADMVKSGQFVPYNTRRLLLYETKYRFCFEKDDELLKIAKSLPRANTWERDGFYWASIPVSYSDEAADFAEIYGFAVGQKAAAKMKEIREAHREKIIPKDTAMIQADAIYKHDETEVIPDLVDED